LVFEGENPADAPAEDEDVEENEENITDPEEDDDQVNADVIQIRGNRLLH
jgi:hypothetical protein